MPREETGSASGAQKPQRGRLRQRYFRPVAQRSIRGPIGNIGIVTLQLVLCRAQFVQCSFFKCWTAMKTLCFASRTP
jgi:hypothetical protein